MSGICRANLLNATRPFRDHPERHAYMCYLFSNHDANIRQTFSFFQIFSSIFSQISLFVTSAEHPPSITTPHDCTIAKLHILATKSTQKTGHYNNILYIIYNEFEPTSNNPQSYAILQFCNFCSKKFRNKKEWKLSYSYHHNGTIFVGILLPLIQHYNHLMAQNRPYRQNLRYPLTPTDLISHVISSVHASKSGYLQPLL